MPTDTIGVPDMPGHALHLQIARSCWERASTAGARLPALTDPVQNALYQGAIGPDMGYYPRSDRFLTDLAHYVRTARLVRTLFASASNDIELAYAAGWLTHFLADTIFHPLVNEECGERLHGSTAQPVTYEDSAPMHIQVELGLDAVLLAGGTAVGTVRVTDVFDAESIRYLVDAYAHTYDVAFSPGEMLRAHRAVARWQGRFFEAMHLAGCRHLGARPSLGLAPIAAPYFGVRWVSGVVARSSPAFGLTHTLKPTDRLAREVRLASETIPARFSELLDHIDELGDVNLDTGLPLDAPYGPRDSTMALLASKAGRSSSDRQPEV